MNWIYAPEDEFIEKRAGAIAAREKLVKIIKSGELNYKAIQEVLDYDSNPDNHNIEQLSAKLLFDLTRNTGLEVSKGKLGECWRQTCMKSKPIIMDHFSTIHTSYVLDFQFTNNITILTGSSATGKTASFSFIKECMAVNPKNLFATSENLFELVSESNGEQTEFRMEHYYIKLRLGGKI